MTNAILLTISRDELHLETRLDFAARPALTEELFCLQKNKNPPGEDFLFEFERFAPLRYGPGPRGPGPALPAVWRAGNPPVWPGGREGRAGLGDNRRDRREEEQCWQCWGATIGNC